MKERKAESEIWQEAPVWLPFVSRCCILFRAPTILFIWRRKLNVQKHWFDVASWFLSEHYFLAARWLRILHILKVKTAIYNESASRLLTSSARRGEPGIGRRSGQPTDGRRGNARAAVMPHAIIICCLVANLALTQLIILWVYVTGFCAWEHK